MWRPATMRVPRSRSWGDRGLCPWICVTIQQIVELSMASCAISHTSEMLHQSLNQLSSLDRESASVWNQMDFGHLLPSLRRFFNQAAFPAF
jgi:hypothetical protein